MSVAYLDQLNPSQRQAVVHGVRIRDTTPAPPLLVIAGAGSGKTNTLAHRVAHLLVNGADPRRILLLTFARRAAGEMTRRNIPYRKFGGLKLLDAAHVKDVFAVLRFHPPQASARP